MSIEDIINRHTREAQANRTRDWDWNLHTDGDKCWLRRDSENIAVLCEETGSELHIAAFIVRCCNSFDLLVAVCKQARRVPEFLESKDMPLLLARLHDLSKATQDALALAEGGATQ